MNGPRNGTIDRNVVQGGAARAALIRGMDLMAGLLRPTLGPIPRTVAVARIVGKEPPEVLDSAATIAKRTIQLADPFEDMGGMIIRDVAWCVFERVGDGSATAAVLAQALMHEAQRHLAAGANPVLIRRGLERGLAIALAELRAQARPIDGAEALAEVVAGILPDPKLAEQLGELVDSVGPDGAVLIEDNQAAETACEYIDGIRWNSGYVSPYFATGGQPTARLVDPRIFVTDHSLERAEQLLPAVEACVGSGARSLVVIGPEIRDAAVGLLLVNRERGVLDGALAIKAPGVGAQQTRILEDLAVATGGRAVLRDLGRSPEQVTADDLGRARQAWANRAAFGILGGQGSRAAIRQRIADARAELSVSSDDRYLRTKIRERIARLSGSGAVVYVGAPSATAQEELKVRIEAAITTTQLALRDGVVAGGGAALLACAPAVAALELAGDEARGAAILARALAEPLRVIARNAGFEPDAIAHEARRRGPAVSFDVVRGEWVDPWASGPVDPLAVVSTALETGVSAVLAAIATEALVRRYELPRALRRR